MAPCLTTSGNVSNNFPEFEPFPGGALLDLNQDSEPNESENPESEDYDWSSFDISTICPEIDFSAEGISIWEDVPINESENNFDYHQHLRRDVFLRSNDDSPQYVGGNHYTACESNGNESRTSNTARYFTFESNVSDSSTSEDIPSHLFDHCYTKYSDPDSNAENEASNNKCSDGFTEEETDIFTSEKIVSLPVSIAIQNNQGRGRRRVRNNVRVAVEKKKNETCSRRRKRKTKVEKDEETRSRHNRMERQRRHKMKHSFQYLASLISDDNSLKYSKVNLLKKARKVIKELQETEKASCKLIITLKNEQKKLKALLSLRRKQ